MTLPSPLRFCNIDQKRGILLVIFRFHIIFFFSRKRLNELAQGLGPYPADLETSQGFIDGKRVYAANNFLKPIYSVPGSIATQGAKKVIFTACHSGKLKPTFTSPNIISTSPKNVLMSRWFLQFFCNLISSKNFTCPWAKLITEFTSPIAKSTSPGLSDTTFFARCWTLRLRIVRTLPCVPETLQARFPPG